MHICICFVEGCMNRGEVITNAVFIEYEIFFTWCIVLKRPFVQSDIDSYRAFLIKIDYLSI